MASIIAKILAPFQRYRYARIGPLHNMGIKGYASPESALSNNPLKKIKIISIKNSIYINSRFTFYYQPADEPKLKILREKYKFDTITAPASNELAKIIILRNWTRSRFKMTEYQPLGKYFDGLKILEENRRDINTYIPRSTYTPCHMLSFLYVQVLLSMGFQARAVTVSVNLIDTHCVVEVWSNLFRKWIVMDVFFNLYYEKDGIPLNAVELHNTRYTGLNSVTVIRGTQTSGDNIYEPSLEELLKWYAYFRVEFRNDWMSNHYFIGHPKRSDRTSVWWQELEFPVRGTLSPKTNDINDLYWPLNQVEICAKQKFESDFAPLKFLFKTITPNFKDFEIIIDDEKRIRQKEAVFCWALHRGENKLSVVSINEYQEKGISSEVVLLKG